MIGINTMKALASAESIGFAVAIDHASNVLNGAAQSSSATPLAGPDAMIRPNAPASADDLRGRGGAGLRQGAGSRGSPRGPARLLWTRYAPTCVRSVSYGGDGAWLSALEAGGVSLANQEGACVDWLDTVATNARTLDQDVRALNEQARRAGVFPGVLGTCGSTGSRGRAGTAEPRGASPPRDRADIMPLHAHSDRCAETPRLRHRDLHP